MKRKMSKLMLGLVAVTALVSCGGSNDGSSVKPVDSEKPVESEKTVDANIKVYTRDTTSGTRDGFFTTIGFGDAKADNAPLVAGFIEVAGNGDMINAIKGDEYGIGYISLSSLATSGLKAVNYEGVEPTEANVLNETYGLTRNFNFMARSYIDPASAQAQLTKAFLAYMGTQEGKATIKANDGIVSILVDDPSWDAIKADHPIVNQDNSGVTLNFGGSTSVEKIAKALSAEFSPLAGNFNAIHNHTGSGDAWKRTYGGDKDGANSLDIGFASREFKAEELTGVAVENYGLICVDAIVTVVNPQNSLLPSASAALLVEIYNGTKTLWSQV
ncbi:MAG: hypothetical protein GX350_00730 [Erysipelotrichaceae bacterium]|nr:hypothetical protein [Erysipelotrichaceae bacterium]